jgi:hypothetical protein
MGSHGGYMSDAMNAASVGAETEEKNQRLEAKIEILERKIRAKD